MGKRISSLTDRGRVLVVLVVLAVGSVAAARFVQSAPHVPPPLPPSDEHTVSCLGHVMKHLDSSTVSIVLAQVVETDPIAGHKYEDVPAKEEDIPMVKGARLAVVETLFGPPASEQLKLVNPPLQTQPSNRPYGKLESVLTRRMRPGEFWLLAYTPSTGQYDLEAMSGVTRLSGPGDPAIRLLKRHVKWIKSSDPLAAINEIQKVVLNPKESALSRSLAQFALTSLPDNALRRRDPKSPLYAAAQRVAVDILKQPNAPDALRHGLSTRSISTLLTR